MDIYPTMLIKGHGLAKILCETNCEALDINFLTDQEREIEREEE